MQIFHFEIIFVFNIANISQHYQMYLSIIVPVYNSEMYINTCLNSLLNQGLDTSEYEIIIINDGSTDGTKEIIESYATKYSNIYVYNQENKGIGATRNIGINLAKGDYIYFIDSDDYLLDDVLSNILSCALEHKLDIITFNSKTTTVSGLLNSSAILKKDEDLKIVNGIEYICNYNYRSEVWWYLMKKEFFETSNLVFAESRWLEDTIFTVTLILKASRIAHLPIDAHRYLTRRGSIMNNRDDEKYLTMIGNMRDVAIDYKPVVDDVASIKQSNTEVINRLKSKQQSFVFYMMIRMLKSTIKGREIGKILSSLKPVNAYPLNNFIKDKRNHIAHRVLARLFSVKPIFCLVFTIVNPILKRK